MSKAGMQQHARPEPETSRVSAVDALVEQIRVMMNSEGLTVGDSLPSERELSARFNAGRNTIREAIRMLKAYGVVDVRPKVGAVIIDRRMDAVVDVFAFNFDMTEEVFRDIQTFRRMIEIGAVEPLFARAVEADIRGLRAINEMMRSAEGPEERASRDYDFHLRLLSIAGNRTLVHVYKILKPQIAQLMTTGKNVREGIDGAFDEHAAVIDALEQRNVFGFQYHMSRHLEAGLSFI
ncbi:transcriptional regulator, GntR family [Pseudoxanthobacter soli DSM 19599]|uniref:Transcriptional regulator, GntR family n=2 Tax=Pseudoxanthobacter TaxID=433838 RepID=A0A1M7ZL56_9HYPH|nr:transcriptional regulator, GntR family [Pseudoxanthobacter soli DSM 19599]